MARSTIVICKWTSGGIYRFSIHLLKYRNARRRLAGTCEIDLTDIKTIDNFVTLPCTIFPNSPDAAKTQGLRVHDNGLPMHLMDLQFTCLSRAVEGLLD